MGCTSKLSGFISVEGPVMPPFTDDKWSYYLLVMGRPCGLCSAPMSPSQPVRSYQCICCQKREEAGEGKGESDGEHNNVSIPSSLQNLSCSESNPTTAELHCIKDVSRVADTTRRTRDGIILAGSDSTGPVPAATFAA